jgi:wyosine [tRNA(Phe)-imidazoG37] synthetase (radical SAM superfamily)
MLLSPHPEIIYGPVNSRRLGNSLGINLIPGKHKLCSFNCVYCHYGWTKNLTANPDDFVANLPERNEVVEAIERAMQSPLEFEYITFSGNGEPTMHSQFPQLVDDVVRLRDQYRPQVKIGLLSNSAGLIYENVHESIPKIDFPMFKLDAGTEKTFRAINRPAKGIDFNTIVNQLYTLSNILIQTVFVDGSPSNTNDDELEAYFEHLIRIKPSEVHIYSIDRPVPRTELALVPPEKLHKIAERGRQKTGLNIRAFYPR